MPVQLPCPFCTEISNTSVPPDEPGLSWLSELLIFDTKNLGIGVESEQMATLRARFGDGDNAKVLGKLEDVKGTTAFTLNVVRVCANASVAESRHSRASGSIEQASSSSSSGTAINALPNPDTRGIKKQTNTELVFYCLHEQYLHTNV